MREFVLYECQACKLRQWYLADPQLDGPPIIGWIVICDKRHVPTEVLHIAGV